MEYTNMNGTFPEVTILMGYTNMNGTCHFKSYSELLHTFWVPSSRASILWCCCRKPKKSSNHLYIMLKIMIIFLFIRFIIKGNTLNYYTPSGSLLVGRAFSSVVVGNPKRVATIYLYIMLKIMIIFLFIRFIIKGNTPMHVTYNNS